MSAPGAASPAGWAEAPLGPGRGALRRLLDGVGAMVWAEAKKLRRDYLDLFTRALQPLLWLFIFGTAVRHAHAFDVGNLDYRAFLAPGVMAQAALFVAIFFGLAVIWERDVGLLQRLLATPLPRTAIVLGKAFGAAVRATAQGVLLLVVVLLAGFGLSPSPLGVVGALVMLALGTAAFAALSMFIASLVKSRERFMGIGQLVTMPLFFASSALYPLAIMPTWLQYLARINPLTYEVQGLRQMLTGTGSGRLWLDFTVVIAFLVAMVAAAADAYPRTVL
jgi:ABC-2 type transport system permease protein